jgi:hypothetical protein
MKSALWWLLVLVLAVIAWAYFAVRPTKIAVVVEEEGSPYERALRDGLRIIDAAAPHGGGNGRRGVVFFDIDGTLLDPSKPAKKYGADLPGGPKTFRHGKNKPEYFEAIDPVAELAREATARGLRVVILTARPFSSSNLEWTSRNLKMHAIPYDELYFDAQKKEFRRKYIAANGIVPVLTVGDRYGDIDGCEEHGYHGILLPGDDSAKYQLMAPVGRAGA